MKSKTKFVFVVTITLRGDRVVRQTGQRVFDDKSLTAFLACVAAQSYGRLGPRAFLFQILTLDEDRESYKQLSPLHEFSLAEVWESVYGPFGFDKLCRFAQLVIDREEAIQDTDSMME